MKVILFRSNNFFDSRVNKYHNYYEREGIDYTIVGWDRKGEGLQKENYDFFRYKAGEAEGGFKAFRSHFMWMRFVYRYLKQHRDVTTIHACDLNAAFPAALFKVFHKKNVGLIFDACDWYSANFARFRVLCFLFEKMERFTCKQANALIICEPERKAQITFSLREEPLVLPNIPEIDTADITEVQEKYKFNNDNPTLAYMGGFARARFLEELLSLAETEPFNLLIAGSGKKEIQEKCVALSGQDNVKYFGRVNMVDGINMENAADVVYAMYCKVNPNHIYAAPNKYYEALLLGKPLITTKGTIPGDKVEKYGTGWTVEESIDELRNLIIHLKKEEIEERGKKALDLWNAQYKECIANFFEYQYSKILQ